MRTSFCTLGAFAALVCTSSTVAAQAITYEFTGTISSISSPPSAGSLWFGIANSDPVTLTYTVDANAMAMLGPGQAIYVGALLDTTLTVGGISVSNPGGDVFVADEFGSPISCTDVLAFQPTPAPGWDIDFPNCDLFSTAPCPNPDYTSINLPTTLPAGATFPVPDMVFDSVGSAVFVVSYTAGTITLPPPANDDCANAIPLPSTFADTPYDATNATTDGLDAMGFCDYGAFGDEQNYNDIWFTYTPDVGGCTYISTFNLAGYDTRITVYDSVSCPDIPANIIACVDDEEGPTAPAPFEAGLDVNLQAGVTYTIRLGTFEAGTMASTGTLRIAAGPGAMNTTGPNPGAPGCVDFPSWCNGDGGDGMGCTDCPCGNNMAPGNVGGCLHSASAMNGGLGSRLLAEGDPSVSLPSGSTTDLKLSMENMPPTSTCVMFSGSGIAPQNMANPCFGRGVAVDLMASGAKDGLRCAVGGLIRHGNRQSDASGDIKDDSGPSRTWGGVAGPSVGLAAQAGFAAGQTRYFQGTHRDLPGAQCMTALNTSQAVEVTFTP